MSSNRRTFLYAFLMVAAAALVRPANGADAPRIKADELKTLVERGEAVILDVRGKDAWDREHVKDAVHIPLRELTTRLGELPKDKLIVAYCT